jgi:hypothetical protein
MNMRRLGPLGRRPHGEKNPNRQAQRPPPHKSHDVHC